MAEGNQGVMEGKDRDIPETVELINEHLVTLAAVNFALRDLEARFQSDGTTSNEESGTEKVDGEQGSSAEKQDEKPPKSSNSTEVGPESPAPATMEGLDYTIPTPGKSSDGVVTESEEAQLKPENETNQSFEGSLINAEKLPEKPCGEGVDDNITTAVSNGELPTEQAHVEDVKNSCAQVPQAKIDEKSESSSKPGNSNTEVTAEINLLKSDDSGNPISEKPNLVPVEGSTVEPKSENSARLESFPEKLESSDGSPREYNSGESACATTPEELVVELENQVFGNLSEPEIAQKETENSVENNSVKESPENLAESKTALQSESLDTETSAVDVAVDSSPKDQN